MTESEYEFYRSDRTGLRHQKMQQLPFIAWDGEGYTDDTGAHHYMLFGNSLGEHIASDSDLSFSSCFNLLLDSAGKGINVIYGGDYDVIMMTKAMPFVVLDRLLHGQPVRYGGYRLQWFRRKYFQISTLTIPKRSVILYDVVSFFQTSFVKACREYLGDSPELDAMEDMKRRRSSFQLGDEGIITYWQSELAHLVSLMDRLRELLREAGILPKGWYGPGAVASALLSQHQMQHHLGRLETTIVDLAERAYYGGRFEQFKVGRIKHVHEYDIRSAYPAAIARLPDLSTATWERSETPTDKFEPFGLYCVSWEIPYKPLSNIGPLPWRDHKGRVFYPLQGYRSWYWGIEAQNLTLFPDSQWTIHEAYLPKGLGQSAFTWVPEMYEERARMKATGNPAQLAMKLGLNSLYGKLAQSKGAKLKGEEWHKPRWHQIAWAGWITAYTRHKMFRAAMMAGANLVAIETDAIFTTKALPKLVLSERLGDWEYTYLDEILYIQSGVYYGLRKGVWKLKSRGVESDGSSSAGYWLDILAKLPHTPVELTATINRFGTVLRSKTYARWFQHSRSVNLPNAFSKRMHIDNLCLTCILDSTLSYKDAAHHLVVPAPLLSSHRIPSTPYKFAWRKDVPTAQSYQNEWDVSDVKLSIVNDMEISWSILPIPGEVFNSIPDE